MSLSVGWLVGSFVCSFIMLIVISGKIKVRF